jgi:DNA-binding YbaB/EbfC family protein
MFDMMGMMGKVKDIQSRIKEIKENLVHITAEGESGAGLVKAFVNGNKQVLRMEIDPSLLKESDQSILQDLIVAAVNRAMKNIDEKTQQEFKEKTAGLIPNIPGMDLGSMFGM